MPRRDPRYYLLGVLLTLSIIAVAWYASIHTPIPAGQLDNAYAAHVSITGAKVSAAKSMMAGSVVYYNGTIVNSGNRTITSYTVELTFKDVSGRPLERVQRSLLNDRLNPIDPYSRRNFEIGFDAVPSGWNQAPPTPKTTAIYVR